MPFDGKSNVTAGFDWEPEDWEPEDVDAIVEEDENDVDAIVEEEDENDVDAIVEEDDENDVDAIVEEDENDVDAIVEEDENDVDAIVEEDENDAKEDSEDGADPDDAKEESKDEADMGDAKEDSIDGADASDSADKEVQTRVEDIASAEGHVVIDSRLKVFYVTPKGQFIPIDDDKFDSKKSLSNGLLSNSFKAFYYDREGKILHNINDSLNAFSMRVTGPAQEVTEGLLSGAFKAVKDVFEGVKNAAGGVLEGVKNAAGGVLEGVKNAIEGPDDNTQDVNPDLREPVSLGALEVQNHFENIPLENMSISPAKRNQEDSQAVNFSEGIAGARNHNGPRTPFIKESKTLLNEYDRGSMHYKMFRVEKIEFIPSDNQKGNRALS